MLYKLTNISGGQIVCDLKEKGKSLRLNNRQSKTFKESEITEHINNLVNKGMLLSEKIQEVTEKTVTKKYVKKDIKEKEE